MPQAKSTLTGFRIQQQLLYIFIFTFVTVIIWIGGSLFRSQRSTGISPDLLELAKPLNPTINPTTMAEIESRTFYSQEDLDNFVIYRLISSQDGAVQRIVPITSDLTEIETEVQFEAQEAPPGQSPQEDLEEEAFQESTEQQPSQAVFSSELAQ